MKERQQKEEKGIPLGNLFGQNNIVCHTLQFSSVSKAWQEDEILISSK